MHVFNQCQVLIRVQTLESQFIDFYLNCHGIFCLYSNVILPYMLIYPYCKTVHLFALMVLLDMRGSTHIPIEISLEREGYFLIQVTVLVLEICFKMSTSFLNHFYYFIYFFQLPFSMTCIAHHQNNKYIFTHIGLSCIDWLIGNQLHVPSAV